MLLAQPNTDPLAILPFLSPSVAAPLDAIASDLGLYSQRHVRQLILELRLLGYDVETKQVGGRNCAVVTPKGWDRVRAAAAQYVAGE